MDGYTRRRYLKEDGSKVTTYEISEPFVFKSDIERLIKRAATLRANRVQFQRVVDPEKIDAVLEALDRKETHRQIAQRLKVSTKTIQRIKQGK